MYKLIFLLFLIATLTASAVTIFYHSFVVEKIVFYNMTVKVADGFGLAVDNESINFGKIKSGYSSKRDLLFTNPSEHSVKVSISTYGAISSWIEVFDKEMVLLPNQMTNLTLEVQVPPNTPNGIYDGKVKLIFKKEIFK